MQNRNYFSIWSKTVSCVAFLAIGLSPTIATSAEIHVDFSYAGIESGTLVQPFNTLSEALAAVGDGDTIQMTGQASHEIPTIDQSVISVFGLRVFGEFRHRVKTMRFKFS